MIVAPGSVVIVSHRMVAVPCSVVVVSRRIPRRPRPEFASPDILENVRNNFQIRKVDFREYVSNI
jgi:hypothetical protein